MDMDAAIRAAWARGSHTIPPPQPSFPQVHAHPTKHDNLLAQEACPPLTPSPTRPLGLRSGAHARDPAVRQQGMVTRRRLLVPWRGEDTQRARHRSSGLASGHRSHAHHIAPCGSLRHEESSCSDSVSLYSGCVAVVSNHTQGGACVCASTPHETQRGSARLQRGVNHQV